ncbi:response regulator transcription factor [Nonomuraea longispora]|uniref:Response regulator transcription factor n=2 Tax=Nonomuraea longispora TaxID=1848320 RepID=A0A4R4NNA1_9ACTN|nr:response regulator transcription factor [Nonomuraea longispora]
MHVVGEATTGPPALQTVRHPIPDVVLMDIRMPELDGLEVTRQLMDDPRTSHCKVIVVTTFDLDEYVSAALALRVCGFLLKRSGPALLTEAVRAAVNGDMLASPQITVRVLRHAHGTLGRDSETGAPGLSTRGKVRNRVGIAAWAWEHGIAQPSEYN